MDCFQDFCLYCDRDSAVDGAYCSQRCKLADLERSNPSSPTASSVPRTERSWTHSASAYTSTSSSTTAARPHSSYVAAWSSQQQQQQRPDERQLTPSSSRTSLSSTSSQYTTTSGSYSRDAKAQLNDYFSSFDQAKAAKRRSSTR